jgi:hypothetical protein
MEVYQKNEIITNLSGCLLGKIRSNVRMIALECTMNFSSLKMYCYTDTLPDKKNVELMEDAIASYISSGDNFKTDFDLSVEFSDKPFDRISLQQDIMHVRYVLYCRYEEQLS